MIIILFELLSHEFVLDRVVDCHISKFLSRPIICRIVRTRFCAIATVDRREFEFIIGDGFDKISLIRFGRLHEYPTHKLASLFSNLLLNAPQNNTATAIFTLLV